MTSFSEFGTFSVSQDALWALMQQLFPLCRSLTGEGVRQTLNILAEHIPLNIHEIPSGSSVFDWTVPLEWNITDAYIKDLEGNRIVDFRKNNLHVVGYSTPFEGTLTLEELQPHLHSLPEQPDAIPYVTSYYKPYWGFCLSHKERASLRANVQYEVKIESSLKPGFLTYADLLIPGKSEEEILISTYICHPSMANNELSGPVVAVFLAKMLLKIRDLRYSYRFIFIPETIGSITYLCLHGEELKKKTVGGYVITCVGDPNPFSYLLSRQEDTLTDRITLHVLKASKEPFKVYSFLERGSDERQYCSPGIDLPIGSLMRSKYGTYPEYHTSLDNLDFVTAEGLWGSLKMYRACLEALDHNYIFKNTILCEPQMGSRGLYPTLSSRESKNKTRRLMDLLAYCDGMTDLLTIADKFECSIFDLIPIAKILCEHNLIVKVDSYSNPVF